MATHAKQFDEFYSTHFQGLREKHDPLIVFPNIRALHYPNPLKTVLHAIVENNPHFEIVRLNEENDSLWKFQCKIQFKEKRMGVCLVNNKTVWFDYDDHSNIKNCYSRHCIKFFRRDQIGGIIKFQYAKDHYHKFPVTVFPFLYPGFNSYRTSNDGYPVVDTQKFRDIFEACCRDNTFTCNLFARWAGFPQRMKYQNICSDIPGVDISGFTLTHSEYLERMSTARFAISVRGNGKFSHREMEAAAIGVPLFYEHRHQMMLYPFLPDEHYISITPGTIKSKLEYYMQHYDEALAIAKRAQEYYNAHLSQTGLQNAFKKIVDMILLEKKWIEH